MDYVKIKGRDIQDCLMQMKMKYGPEAHVYEHRVLTEGGLFGTGLLANKMYEIDVAIPEKASSKERVEKKLNDLRELLKKKSQTPSAPSSVRKSLDNLPQFQSHKLVTAEPLQSVRNRAHANVDFNYEEDQEVQELLSSTLEDISDIAQEEILFEEIKKSDQPSNKPQQSKDISHEIGLSFQKEMIHRVPESKDLLSPALDKLKNKFINEGMSQSYATELMEEVAQHLSPMEKGRIASVWEKAAHLLEDRIKVDSDLLSGTKKGKRKVVFIIGPTGSGKTTTVAKLAAKYFLHMGKSVSLYTTDNYRIAAVEQLKRYADTMDLPFYSVKDVRKFREALLRDGSELVLVDTAGYSHKDRETLYKMKEFYSALGEKDQLENILVISSTVSRQNAFEVSKAYEELIYNRIILSKIDETDYLGSFLELADTNHKEFAYFSVGQDVPFDIIASNKKLLAECVVYPEKMKGMTGEEFTAKN
ncbi:MAG: flagellar biosynthesis protein FlhF [Leptospira sp.]|nr:MAG: flagellar biosynthesis protein FlhF [Leptospira sp.]